jgi:hypothetical protein
MELEEGEYNYTPFTSGHDYRYGYDPSYTGEETLYSGQEGPIGQKLAAGKYPKGDPGWALAAAIGRGNKGIGYNPMLTGKRAATEYVQNLKRVNKEKYGGWNVTHEDLDLDPNTPDDVIITDANGNPVVVSGYRIKSGASRRKAAILYNQYPNRRAAATVRKQIKAAGQARLFNKYLSDQASHARNVVPYNEDWTTRWIGSHPRDNPEWYSQEINKTPYARVTKIVHDALGQIEGPKTPEYGPYYMDIARMIIKEIYEKIKKSSDLTEKRDEYINANQQKIRESAELRWKQHATHLHTTYGKRIPTVHLHAGIKNED